MTAKILAFEPSAESLPTPVNGKVPPRRVPNAEVRTREYLTEPEIERLMKAARKVGRHGHRDATLILVGFSHGFRVSELVTLKWDQIDLAQGFMHVVRTKNGTPATHPLRGSEIRALRRLQREYPNFRYVFKSERRGPLTTSSVRKLVARAGEKAGFPFPIHPHMLRHSTGFYLANKGIDTRSIQAFLGHRSISATTIYTTIAPGRFKDFWSD